MAKIITMGEIMLRLSTPGYQKYIQSDSFNVNYGGGEANVAVSLANYGHDTCFITKVPKNPLGECAVAALRKYNVNCNHIARGGERLGIYFLETGASMRASNVVYDRAHSSMAEAEPTDFDFDAIFKDADWFHFSGITPGISDQAALVVEEACKAAKQKNITISFDLNYRKKLWPIEKAQKVLPNLMQYVDIFIGSAWDAENILGIEPENTDIKGNDMELERYINTMNQLMRKYNIQYVLSTLRESISASDNGWAAKIYDGKDVYHSKRYNIHIVDRVGGGDAFAGGFICGLLDGKTIQESLEFAVAASALKHTIPGDFNLVSREEVETLVAGDTSGRVQR